MGKYQKFRLENNEQKLFYIINDLYAGMNTEYSDDSSDDNEFEKMLNFDLSSTGSLEKRYGWGKSNAISEILQLFEDYPITYLDKGDRPEFRNDNICYMKIIRNDNRCFNALLDMADYREYQMEFGLQHNTFKVLIITSKATKDYSDAWLLTVTMTEQDNPLDINLKKFDMPLRIENNLLNPETIEYYNKIYFVGKDRGLFIFDIDKEEFDYKFSNGGMPNNCYKPNAIEVRKVGFNVLCNDPLHDINYQGITTETIQGIYLTTMDDVPVLKIPNDGKFRLNILHTGNNTNFAVTFTTGTNEVTHTKTKNTSLSTQNVTVYDVVLETSPTGETEIKIEKVGSELEPYYDYYDIGSVDSEAKAVQSLNLGGYGVVEMYNRAVYYKDDTIWFSDINIFDYVPNYNYVTLPISSTDRITKIVYFKNIYVVFTEQTIYKINGAFGDSNFSVEPINLTIGCVAPQTVVHIDNELYFLSNVGIYALVSSAYREDTENLKELDLKVKTLTMGGDVRNSNSVKYIDKLKGIQSYASAIRYKDKYMLFTNNKRLDGTYVSAQNYDVIVYNTSLKAFNVLNYKVKPQFIFQFEGKLLTYCLFAEEKIYDTGEYLMAYDANARTGSTVDGKTILIDQTLNGYNSTLEGSSFIGNDVLGVNLNGATDQIKLPSARQDLTKKINISTRLKARDGRCPIVYLGKESIYLDPETQKQTGSITIDTVYGYKYVLDYTVIADLDKYKANPEQKYAKIDYKITCSYKNAVKDVVDKIVIKTKNSTINTHNNVAAANGTIVQSFGEFAISNKLAINDTIYFELTSNYKVPVQVMSDPESGSKNGYAYQSNGYTNVYEYYNNVYYTTDPENNRSKITKFDWRVSDIRQDITYPYGWTMNTIVSIDYSHDGANWTNIYYSSVFYGTIDFRNVRDYAGTVDLSNSNIYAPHDAEGKCYIRAFIVNDLSGGTLPPRGTFNTTKSTLLPTITSKTEYESKTVVNSGNKNVVAGELVGDSKEEFMITYDTDINEIELKTIVRGFEDRATTRFRKQYNDFVNMYITIDKANGSAKIFVDNDVYDIDIPNLKFADAVRDYCFIGYNPNENTRFKGTISNFSLNTVDGSDTNVIYYYKMDEGSGNRLNHISGVSSMAAILTGSWDVIKTIVSDKYSSIKLPTLLDNHRFANGFRLEASFKLNNSLDYGDIVILSSYGSCPISVYKVENSDKIQFVTTSLDFYEGKLEYEGADIYFKHDWVFECLKLPNDGGYKMSIYKDGVIVKTDVFKSNIITNIKRDTNMLMTVSGNLYNYKTVIYESSELEDIYKPCLFENYKAYTDFNEPIEIELRTKGINLNYPMHIKKLKNIFVKGTGGFAYDEFVFELFNDGHIVNDSRKYYVKIENGEVIYDYDVEKALSFDEAVATLGNFRLDKTKLGESAYQTKKLIIPAKGKNFFVHLKGESSQYLSIESIGFVFKLGKVKQD